MYVCMVGRLAEAGSDLDIKAGVSGRTALHMCAEAGDVETAELLLELGSDSTC